MSAIIKVENLGKSYIIDHEQRESYTALRDVIARNAKKVFSFPQWLRSDKAKVTHEEFWALKDVNFEINQGDAVGIIGRNGAGKSTLLKVLSRITEPTTGKIEMRGRVASLLEVGTGFHPELTGHENIYLNGAILGMSRQEIKRKFDEIVDFSGVEKFLDTPVKRYSSGMYVRLAFAVAAHLEPEILVVDEVLAVGDAEFQKKCLGKMNDVSQKEGRTVIFVSHNMAAVESLCKKSIILQSGKIIFEGGATESIRYYLENGVASNTHFVAKNESQYIGNENIKIVAAKIESADDNQFIDVTSDVYFSVTLINNTKEEDISIGYDLQSVVGDTIFGSGLKAKCPISMPTRLTCHIPKNFLNDGMYSIFFYGHTKSMSPLYDKKDLLTFEVKDSVRDNGYLGKINGAVRTKFNWLVQ